MCFRLAAATRPTIYFTVHPSQCGTYYRYLPVRYFTVVEDLNLHAGSSCTSRYRTVPFIKVSQSVKPDFRV